jgi:hypothetical protein
MVSFIGLSVMQWIHSLDHFMLWFEGFFMHYIYKIKFKIYKQR